MNNISLSQARVEKTHPFQARGEQGIDITVCDKTEYGTAYFQITLYGEPAIDALGSLMVGNLINVSGTLRVQVYHGKDGTEKVSLVIEHTGKIYNYSRNQMIETESQQQINLSAPENDPDLPF